MNNSRNINVNIIYSYTDSYMLDAGNFITFPILITILFAR